MTWLDEIDGYSQRARIYNEIESGSTYPETEMERMARVLREQNRHLADVKVWAEHAGLHLIDIDDPILEELRLQARRSWENMSNEAKELLHDTKDFQT